MHGSQRQAGTLEVDRDNWLRPRGDERGECFENALNKLHKLMKSFDDRLLSKRSIRKNVMKTGKVCLKLPIGWGVNMIYASRLDYQLAPSNANRSMFVLNIKIMQGAKSYIPTSVWL